MRIVRSIEEMRRVSRAAKGGAAVLGEATAKGGAAAQTLALVPTMGAIHAGHLALVRAARAGCEHVAASVFVNPLQFGLTEDFAKYPRSFDKDCELLAAEGVEFLFAPTAEEMYPRGAEAWVDVPGIGGRLDGAARPGHFRGVATVVAKLLHIVQPDQAFFGQKDAAQVAVLRAMVRDLNFDVAIVVCPTVREADGLALSSRNSYLSAAERRRALRLSRALREAERAVGEGQQDAVELRKILLRELQAGEGVDVEYAEIVDGESLERVSDVGRGALMAVAARVGGTRLIDNVVVGPECERESGRESGRVGR